MLGTLLKIELEPSDQIRSNSDRDILDQVLVWSILDRDKLNLVRAWSNSDWDRLGNFGQIGIKFELGLRSGQYLSNDTLPLGGKPRMTIVTAVTAAVKATGKIKSSIM